MIYGIIQRARAGQVIFAILRIFALTASLPHAISDAPKHSRMVRLKMLTATIDHLRTAREKAAEEIRNMRELRETVDKGIARKQSEYDAISAALEQVRRVALPTAPSN